MIQNIIAIRHKRLPAGSIGLRQTQLLRSCIKILLGFEVETGPSVQPL